MSIVCQIAEFPWIFMAVRNDEADGHDNISTGICNLLRVARAGGF
jgi:hypothetical protein